MKLDKMRIYSDSVGGVIIQDNKLRVGIYHADKSTNEAQGDIAVVLAGGDLAGYVTSRINFINEKEAVDGFALNQLKPVYTI